MKKLLLLFIGQHIISSTFGQFSNNIWCFGDSALIDFSTPIPSTGQCSLEGRGSCCSIADANDQLLFYANTFNPALWQAGSPKMGVAWNKLGQLMDNGSPLVGEGWYNEMTILPFPDDSTKFYLMQVGIDNDHGVFYSTIDMTFNGGLGKVIQKNILLSNHEMFD